MGTINTVRIINLNYNNNSIKVNDEIFNLNGQSTLISLHNGGGKSVLVQMLTAPFVHAKYRNAKDRPFEGYFTTRQPTIVLIEWLLDNSKNKLMTGYMVRQNQESDEENPNNLDMIGIISEYDNACINDIYSLPVVEKTKKEMKLKSYGDCKQLFDNFKKDRSKKFFWYDMNSYAQSRQYFDKLKEYKIDYREWEHIIKKINEKESGLSDLFADCKNESDLVDKWFLDTVEKKLDPEKEKIKNFRDIVGKYARQYRDNESKIKQRDYIRLFKDHVLNDDEKTSVRTIAEEYTGYVREQEVQENKIACFLDILKNLETSSEEKLSDIDRQTEDTEAELRNVIYEKYSYDIHTIEQELKEMLHEREQILIEIRVASEDQENTVKELAILDCAKMYESYREEFEACQEKEAKIKKLHEANENLLPKINELGGCLYRYTRRKSEKLDDEAAEIHGDIESVRKTGRENEEIISASSEELLQKTGALGEQEFAIRSFSKKEAEFNSQWNKDYSRNVLGRYEDGLFEIEKDIAGKKIRELNEKQKQTAALLARLEQERLNLDKERIDAERRKSGLEEKIIGLRSKIEALNADIEIRKNLVILLQIPEADIFDTDFLKNEFDKKIEESNVSLQQLHGQVKTLMNEITCLKNGVIAELPHGMVTAIENLGIHMVYGLEWLIKNDHSLKENQQLVRNNPFLPYSLIMTENDIQKLRSSGIEFYHQLPIPIIDRRDLETGNFVLENNMVSFDKITFFINFDEKLLDEKEREMILFSKEKELDKLNSKIGIKTGERDNYYSQRGILVNQKLSKTIYDAAVSDEKECEEGLKELAEVIESTSAALTSNSDEIKKNEKLYSELADDVKESERYRSGLSLFEESYNDYLSALEKRTKLMDTINKLKNRLEVAEAAKKKCHEREEILKNRLRANSAEQGEVSKELARYQMYKDTESSESEVPEEDVLKLRAEFNALTSKFSGDIAELEQDVKRIKKKIGSIERDIKKTSDENGLTKEEYSKVSYNEEIESSLRKKYRELKAQIDLYNSKYSAGEARIAAVDQKKKNTLQNMQKDTGIDEPRNVEDISSFDFEARQNILQHKKQELGKEFTLTKEKINGYAGIIDGLSEYSDYVVREVCDFDVDFESMSRRELSDFTAELKKTNNRIGIDIQKSRNKLSDRIQEVLNLDNLAEEQYKKPLRSMLRMLDRPQDILDQIDITVHALDTLMEKLAVDIEIVEKERDEIIDELASYLEEINTGLGRIDSNSTIKVQGKSLKMLQIKVPLWYDSREIYLLRLKDYLGEVTANIIRLLNKNENPDNELSSKINVNKLYDAVVGVSNVEIQIYKIEKQRTYPISWADAAKNSGGEGFLSTFVILSSLLYYIRKDESDIFAERNEGKVLLMDNPFAQTNAEHLLKPLMDMAKKNNTQLICLSGLGGESIYGRFDNIYVLNLIESRLSGGKQYLGVEHKRGAEPQRVVSSQVEIYDQMTLF